MADRPLPLDSARCPICHRFVLWDPAWGPYRDRRHIYHWQCQRLYWYSEFADWTKHELLDIHVTLMKMERILDPLGFNKEHT